MLGKCARTNSGSWWLMSSQTIIEAVALDLAVDRAGDDVARRELGALVVARHEALAGARVLEDPALAADRLGDEEILDLQIVEAGRVELHEFHVRHAAPGAPRHGDAVAGRAARRGRIEIGAARAAGGEHGRPRGQRLDPLLGAIVGIDAVDRAAGREIGGVAAGDEVDRDPVGQDLDIGIGEHRFLERLLDRPAGGVGDMDDAAVRMAALAGQMQRVAILARERHAELDQPGDRARRLADDILDDRAVVEARRRRPSCPRHAPRNCRLPRAPRRSRPAPIRSPRRRARPWR